jgi:hypothetical protein
MLMYVCSLYSLDQESSTPGLLATHPVIYATRDHILNLAFTFSSSIKL